jgi:RNA polymerase sigma factor (sigma-70 family)
VQALLGLLEDSCYFRDFRLAQAELRGKAVADARFMVRIPGRAGPMPPDFAQIYDEHVWRVYGFIAYRVRDRADAEDLTQQTFERALRAWGRFDPQRSSVGTWLMSIAHNLVVDFYRADRSAAQDPIGPGGVAEEALPALEDAGDDPGVEPEIANALEELQPRERELIALRFGGDLTGPEIAELTGLTLANVQQILSRSLRKLRAALEPESARGRPG